MMKLYNERLFELRNDHDFTQQQVADVLGIVKQNYYRYEKGLRDLPMKHIVTLSRFYNTSADYILGLTNNPQPYERAK